MKQSHQSLMWLFAGGVLMIFSNGRWIIPVATWIYPICFLRYLRLNKAGPGFLKLICLTALANVICFWKMIPVPLGLYFLLTIIALNFPTISFLADRLIAAKIRGFQSTLVFPSLWCSFEYLLSLTSKGTWFSLAYTQFEYPMLIQLVSVTGIWGISFMITWFASVVNWIWTWRFDRPRIFKGSLTYLCAGIIVLLFGFMRLRFSESDSKMVRIASIVNSRQTNAGLATCKWSDAHSISPYRFQIEENLLRKTEESISSGAKMVIWQESAGFIPKQEEYRFIRLAQELAERGKIYLLMTLWSVPEDYPKKLVENKLLVIDTAGKIRLTYFKNNPAPPEPILKGRGGLPVLETSYGKISSAICADADYQNFVRQAGRKKADILFVAANDWKAIDPLHAHMAVFRAIENGFSLVRPAGQGLSLATDNRGKIIKSMDYFTTEEQVMYADIPIGNSYTWYARMGDYFAWLCMVTFVSLVLTSVYRFNPKVSLNPVN